MAHAKSAAELGSAEEAAAFAAKAADILAQHKIGLSDVELMAEGATDTQGSAEYAGLAAKGRTAWYVRLAGSVARSNFCHLLWMGRGNVVTITGRDSDRAVCSYLIETLTRNGERLAVLHSRQVMADYRRGFLFQKPSNPKLSFLAGYAEAIEARLVEQKRHIEQHNPHAVIRLTNALQESRQHARNTLGPFGRMRSSGRGAGLSPDAGSYGAGKEAGRAANLNAGVGAGGQMRAAMRLGAGH